jgi:hypothetical protein
MPLPNQENKNKEEMRTSTHELRWVQTYDPLSKYSTSLRLHTTGICSQNNCARMQIS